MATMTGRSAAAPRSIVTVKKGKERERTRTGLVAAINVSIKSEGGETSPAPRNARNVLRSSVKYSGCCLVLS